MSKKKLFISILFVVIASFVVLLFWLNSAKKDDVVFDTTAAVDAVPASGVIPSSSPVPSSDAPPAPSPLPSPDVAPLPPPPSSVPPPASVGASTAVTSVVADNKNVVIDVLKNPPGSPSPLFKQLAAYDIRLRDNAKGKPSASITFKLDARGLDNLQLADLGLYAWQKTKGGGFWNRVRGSKYDAAKSVLTAQLSHFSPYALRAPIKNILSREAEKKLMDSLDAMIAKSEKDPNAVGYSIDIEESSVFIKDGKFHYSDDEYYATKGCHADSSDGENIEIKRMDVELADGTEYVIKMAVHTKYDHGADATLNGSVINLASSVGSGVKSAVVTATNEKTGKVFTTSSGVDGKYSLKIGSGTYTLSAEKSGCTSKPSTGNLFCAFGNRDEDETLYYGGKAKSFKQNLSVECASSAPIIQSFNWKQLHGEYEDLPHKYLLSVNASDPQNGLLRYSWSVDCGYFVPPPATSGFTVVNRQVLVKGVDKAVEWHYDTPGECVDAVITIDAINNFDQYTTLKRKIFD